MFKVLTTYMHTELKGVSLILLSFSEEKERLAEKEQI